MDPAPPRLALRLSLFSAALISMLGVFMPFWSPWLAHRGFTPIEIAWLLALPACVRSLVGPLVANVVDRSGRRREAIVVLAVLCVAVFGAIWPVHSFLMLLPLCAVFQSSYSALVPLYDSFTILVADQHGLQFGRIRLWGSLSFLVISIASGRMLKEAPPDLIYALILACLLLTCAALPLLPRRDESPKNRADVAWRRLLGVRSFGWLVITYALIQSSHAAYYAYSTLRWGADGIGEFACGVLWAMAVLSEIVCFATGSKLLLRAGPVRLLLLGACAGIVRWALIGNTTSLPLLFALQCLHSLTYAGSYLAALHLIARMVPIELTATAQSLLSAVTSLVMALATLLAGSLFGGHSVLGAPAFLAMSGIAAAGLCAGFVLDRALAPASSAK